MSSGVHKVFCNGIIYGMTGMLNVGGFASSEVFCVFELTRLFVALEKAIAIKLAYRRCKAFVAQIRYDYIPERFPFDS